MAFVNTRSLMVFVFVALAATGLVAGNKIWAQDKKTDTAPAAAAAATPATPPAEAWVKRCDDIKDGEKVTGKYCEAVQSLSVVKKDADPSTAQRVAEIAIGYPPVNKGKASGAAIVPLGVLTQNKIEMLVDNEKLLTFNIRYCDNGGCIGLFDLSDSDVTKLTSGKEITMKTEVVTGQPLVITLSLNGLGKILGQIKPKI